jgi:hypothetical protein
MQSVTAPASSDGSRAEAARQLVTAADRHREAVFTMYEKPTGGGRRPPRGQRFRGATLTATGFDVRLALRALNVAL